MSMSEREKEEQGEGECMGSLGQWKWHCHAWAWLWNVLTQSSVDHFIKTWFKHIWIHTAYNSSVQGCFFSDSML